MAQWSQRAIEQRKQEAQAAQIEERLRLFGLYRKNGWTASVHCAYFLSVLASAPIADETAMGPNVYFVLKPPGAYPVVVRSLDELRRKAGGLK